MFERNKEWYIIRILMKYHALLVIFEKKKTAKFEIVVCCKL